MNPQEPSSSSFAPPPPPRPKINWLAFWLILLAPPVLTIFSVLLLDKKGDLSPVLALLASGLAGIVCGAMLACHFGKTPAAKVALGILFALALSSVCIGASCFGCLTTGYNLKF